MSRVKGSPKIGGRRKGTPNKVTGDLKKWIAEILEGNKEAFVVNLQASEPKDFCKTYTTLLGYVLPKMVAVTPQEQAAAEFSELEALFNRLPDEAIIQIANKVLELEAKNGC